jgi:hypothetical protein
VAVLQEQIKKSLNEFHLLHKSLRETNQRLSSVEEAQKKRDEEFGSVAELLKKYLHSQMSSNPVPKTPKRRRDDFLLEISNALDREISVQVSKFFFFGSVKNILPNLKSMIETILQRYFPDAVQRTQKLKFALICVRKFLEFFELDGKFYRLNLGWKKKETIPLGELES